MWQGLKEGFEPLIPLFQRIGTAFEPVLKPIKTVFDWFKKLIKPVEDTGGKAESMGLRVGKAIAGIIVKLTELVTKAFECGRKITSMLAQGIMSGLRSRKTFKLRNKFYSMPDIGEQVVCLMDENSEDGVILGSIYSSVDTPAITNENQISLNLENNSLINIDKNTDTLTITFKNINLNGNINHTGLLSNTDGITSNADISDKTSSMQTIRDIYNSHNHTGIQGSPTSAPDNSM